MLEPFAIFRQDLKLQEAVPEQVAFVRDALEKLKSLGDRSGIAELVRREKPWCEPDLQYVLPSSRNSSSDLPYLVRSACIAPGALEFGPASWFELALDFSLPGDALEPWVETVWFEWASAPLPDINEVVVPAPALVDAVERLRFDGVPVSQARERAAAIADATLPAWQLGFDRARTHTLAVARTLGEHGLVLAWTTRL